MENVFDAGKIPYVAAPPLVPWTMWKKITFTFYLLCDISMILVMSIPNWLEALYRLFISRRKKCVRGQVALVRKIHLILLFVCFELNCLNSW